MRYGPLLRNDGADAALRNPSPEEPRVREPRVIDSPSPEDATNAPGRMMCIRRACVLHVAVVSRTQAPLNLLPQTRAVDAITLECMAWSLQSQRHALGVGMLGCCL